jgi:predicted RNase H-like HicB family nuclease
MAKPRAAAVQISLRAPYSFSKEGAWIVASCEPLDVVSQGRNEREAMQNLVEALQLFIEDCFEEGTLEQVLKECGGRLERAGPVKPDWLAVDVPLSLIAHQHNNAQAGAD